MLRICLSETQSTNNIWDVKRVTSPSPNVQCFHNGSVALCGLERDLLILLLLRLCLEGRGQWDRRNKDFKQTLNSKSKTLFGIILGSTVQLSTGYLLLACY